MSGIVGIYNLDSQPVEQQNLTLMVDAIAHRGSDGTDIWSAESTGLGHRMLWTTPESLLEKLPLVDLTGELVITTDLRIDNRDELISALSFDHYPPEKITDSQLVLAAYEKWGEQCPKQLLGDFAFAIWDTRKQTLFCARDHFGIKPLYYYYQPGQQFCFASEIKALLCLPEVPRKLNEIAIANYLHPFTEDKSITSYQDIYRLPPGHAMTVSYTGGLQSYSYWSLEVGEELRLNSDAEYAEAFREIFTEAVRCRLRSAFPVSCHLSGGLDSSSIACVARDILQTKGIKLHTFSNIFEEVPECDERQYINPVLHQGGFIPYYVHADQSGPISEWQKYYQYMEEPFIGPSHFLVWGLNRATQQAGIRISLDGFDGDTTVSHGVTYFAELARQGKWQTFIQEAQAISQHFNTSLAALFYQYAITYLQELVKQRKYITFGKTAWQIGQHFRVSRRKLFVRYGIKPLVPEYILRIWRSLRGHKQNQPQVTPLINPQFAKQVGINPLTPSPEQDQSPAITVREEQWRTLNSALFTTVLELGDLCAAAFSLESRHPFMDKRLIEFCLSLPPEQKIHQGWSRFIMRRALDGILPQEVQWRGGKTDMTPNFQRGLLHLDRQLVDEMITSDVSNIKKFVDLNSLHRSYNRLLSKTEATNDDDIVPAWKAVTLALWLKHTQIQTISRARGSVS
ncbi:lasso peptide isopeptide bond-forming cyclase [Fortiea sp. LEGE XX443]|uniref:lasso peptide isopeptide bond-forming cyclase n=1 Tax=Fortiea sp. LEGE XX443 TaxID=1828611 RepID=UPI00187E50E1|nr:lasso peptide isopeptide bond-forming cyclase [Fortiea sp. LEGE XX443]MBE9005963.1 lasso peptide isopeptide bond-forming cyclase [Fortiea sp. LEGE XX443]